jgi:hypothetical protein
MSKQKTIAFDLDDVICHRPDGYEHLGPDKYDYCIPNNSIIDIINSLHFDGHKIVIYTARGMSQYKGNVDQIYKELYTKTINHLNEWGVSYDELVMGKIHYDILIDDKALNSSGITKEAIAEFLYE